MKKFRIDYSNDINFINAENCIKNLFTIYEIGSSEKMILSKLFNDIVKIEDNRNKVDVHDEMNNLLEHFWNFRETINVEYKINKRIRRNLEESKQYLDSEDFKGALVSIIRVPEYFYLSHKELSDIQSNPEDNFDQIPMLSTIKSIFKHPNKEVSLSQILEMNKEDIKNHCGEYDPNMGKAFVDYVMNEKFHNPEVSFFMKTFKAEVNSIYKDSLSGKRKLFCSKVSSHFFPGTKSILEDNFWEYDSKTAPKELIDKLMDYNKLSLEGNYDYLNLAFGLGADYKLRNVVFTNSMLQNIGSIYRFAAKRTFEIQEKMYFSPIRTDNQLGKFTDLLKTNNLANKYKICFDISKYSDYLLSQIIELLIDYSAPTVEYATCLKKIQNLPIKIKDNYYNILFGTGAGIKSNFDLITIANMLMIDFTGYYYDIIYDNENIVGDDLFVTSQNKDFQQYLIKVYTHMNCKINIKKTKLVSDTGRISFCNRHFWYELEEVSSWNGISPGLWMKEIYSLNRLNAIFKLMKETWQPINIIKIRKLFEINLNNISREFKYNKMEEDPEVAFKKMELAPYNINGFKDDTIFELTDALKWAEEAHGLLDNYIFAMKNNVKVQEMFSKYYDLFPEHPIIESFLFTNGKYLEIIEGINHSYDSFVKTKEEEEYRVFKKWIKRAITEFGKLDAGSSRISTKDRTSDYFNEDLFWKQPSINIKESIHRFSSLELKILSENDSKVPLAEIYLKVMTKHLVRNGKSNLWDNYSGVYIDLPSGIVGRLYTKSNKIKDNNYWNWDCCSEEIFDVIYPGNPQINKQTKYDCVKELASFISKLKKEGVKESEDIMNIFES